MNIEYHFEHSLVFNLTWLESFSINGIFNVVAYKSWTTSKYKTLKQFFSFFTPVGRSDRAWVFVVVSAHFAYKWLIRRFKDVPFSVVYILYVIPVCSESKHHQASYILYIYLNIRPDFVQTIKSVCCSLTTMSKSFYAPATINLGAKPTCELGASN